MDGRATIDVPADWERAFSRLVEIVDRLPDAQRTEFVSSISVLVAAIDPGPGGGNETIEPFDDLVEGLELGDGYRAPIDDLELLTRGVRWQHQQVEASIGVTQAAERLGVSRQSVHNWIRARRLLAFRVGSRWLLPQWQFETLDVLERMPVVLAVLRGGSDVERVAWFDTARVELGGVTPAAALQHGDTEAVASLARAWHAD